MRGIREVGSGVTDGNRGTMRTIRYGFWVFWGIVAFGAMYGFNHWVSGTQAVRSSRVALAPVAELTSTPAPSGPVESRAKGSASRLALKANAHSSPEHIMEQVGRVQEVIARALETPCTIMLAVVPTGGHCDVRGVVTLDFPLFCRLSEGAAVALAAEAIGWQRSEVRRSGKAGAGPLGQPDSFDRSQWQAEADEFCGYVVGASGYGPEVFEELLGATAVPGGQGSSRRTYIDERRLLAFQRGYADGRRRMEEAFLKVGDGNDRRTIPSPSGGPSVQGNHQ